MSLDSWCWQFKLPYRESEMLPHPLKNNCLFFFYKITTICNNLRILIMRFLSVFATNYQESDLMMHNNNKKVDA